MTNDEMSTNVHFTSERDARVFARQHARKVFRVDRQRRTELKVRPMPSAAPDEAKETSK